MDGCQRQKRTADFELNKDFLSSMPSEMIENILVRLPIKEAVRTSVLSRKWKSSWASMPDLVFAETCIPESKLIESVDKVLQAHQGSILKFELELGRLRHHVREVAIKRWLLVLSKKGLKDLRLCFGFNTDYNLPSSLFSCHKLEHLQIIGCHINAPRCFQGLKLLRNLRLDYCRLERITIEKFVLGCPLLESLTLRGFHKPESLVIRAPNLKHLTVCDSFNDFLLETPKLVSATIYAYYVPHGFQEFGPVTDGCKSKLLRALGALSNIEELDIWRGFCEYLGSGPIPEKLPVTFHHLKKISIGLDARSKAVDVTLCIFRNAPNLKTLSLRWLPSENIWEEQRMRSISEVVEVVVLNSFGNYASLLAFAKFILSTAPRLKEFIVDVNSEDEEGPLMEVESLPRLSRKAVIIRRLQ